PHRAKPHPPFISNPHESKLRNTSGSRPVVGGYDQADRHHNAQPTPTLRLDLPLPVRRHSERSRRHSTSRVLVASFGYVLPGENSQRNLL
ncbi:hypothetical protein AAF712_016874, partial [Marasmius tenuissimus]